MQQTVDKKEQYVKQTVCLAIPKKHSSFDEKFFIALSNLNKYEYLSKTERK